MLRLTKYYGKQEIIGSRQLENSASDDVTSMAEIVKRFFNNEPIPQTQEQENWQYEDPVKLDENGKPVYDSNGRMITEDVLTNETLELIPITPNLDEHEIVDDEDTNKFYDDATDRARAIVRQRNIELAEQKLKADNLTKENAIKIATENGYVKKEFTDNKQ